MQSFIRQSGGTIIVQVDMDNSPKREGSDLKELEQEVKNTTVPITNGSKILCVWGIEKFFDSKQCYRFFCKNFGTKTPVTHLLKPKSKPFFLIQLEDAMVAQDFNKTFATGKRAKAKAIQEGMQIEESQFKTIEEITRPAERREVKATEEEWKQVREAKIEDIVSPLHKLPYEEQVAFKVKELNRVTENYNRQFFRDNEVLRKIKEGEASKQLDLGEFVQCDVRREGYRSKSEFTIGRNMENEITIGFNKGSYHNQTITIESPRNVQIISKNTKFVVALLENFIKTTFPQLAPFDRLKHEGFWRYLVVRESERTKQTLVMVVCKTESVDEGLLQEAKGELVEYMKKSIRGLVGLCFMSYNGESDSVPTDKPELLYGVSYYEERIFQRLFQVSFGAFLQIHIDMCEILYSRIIEAVKDCDVVLDLGCGIGTIGISIQDQLPNVKVIGVEICAEAVEDARKNSPTYEVQLGRAEDLIKGICDKYRGNRIVAILDPPRAGFNKEVIQALRRCRGLDNIVYVACNAGAIQDNLLQLTLPVTEKRKAPEFLVKEMKGYDLFPSTSHYEALYILQRKE